MPSNEQTPVKIYFPNGRGREGTGTKGPAFLSLIDVGHFGYSDLHINSTSLCKTFAAKFVETVIVKPRFFTGPIVLEV